MPLSLFLSFAWSRVSIPIRFRIISFDTPLSPDTINTQPRESRKDRFDNQSGCSSSQDLSFLHNPSEPQGRQLSDWRHDGSSRDHGYPWILDTSDLHEWPIPLFAVRGEMRGWWSVSVEIGDHKSQPRRSSMHLTVSWKWASFISMAVHRRKAWIGVLLTQTHTPRLPH